MKMWKVFLKIFSTADGEKSFNAIFELRENSGGKDAKRKKSSRDFL